MITKNRDTDLHTKMHFSFELAISDYGRSKINKFGLKLALLKCGSLKTEGELQLPVGRELPLSTIRYFYRVKMQMKVAFLCVNQQTRAEINRPGKIEKFRARML